MSITFQGVQDALIALTTVAGVAIVFALAILATSRLVLRDKARNKTAPAATLIAQHPTQTDRVRELVSH